MSVRNLERLFKPASVALIGAVSEPGSIAAVVARNLQRARFPGDLTLVDPNYQGGDLRAYPDIASLPQAPDLALITTPLDRIPALIGEIGERGTRAAIVFSPSAASLGGRYPLLRRAMLDAAKPYLLRVMGPDSLGIIVPRLGLDASFAHLPVAAGSIAFVSQSGAIVTAMLDWAAARAIGFSHVVALGDVADVDLGDMLDYLATDAGTRAILVYLDAVTHGRKFMSAARAAARGKPVLVLKAGRVLPPALATGSGCGALTGADAVYDAAFRRAGALRVKTMTELFDAAETLASTREQIGDRLAILTNSGGAGLLASDALAAAGGHAAVLSDDTIAAVDSVLPSAWSGRNLIDLGGTATGKHYADALAVLIEDRGVDAVLVLNSPSAMIAPEECASAVVETVSAMDAAAVRGKNIFTAWLGEYSAQVGRRMLTAAGIAAYETPDGAVAGFLQRVRHQRNRELLMEAPPARADPFSPDAAVARRAITAAIAANRTWLDGEAAAAVLAAYGIPLAAIGRKAATVEEAVAMAAEIGFPVALKICSPDIAAKARRGGVALDLSAPDEVRRKAWEMIERLAWRHPEARLEGFRVHRMVRRPGAVELAAGVVDDPVFGPLVAFGQRGFTGETAGDCSLELPPLNELLARRLIDRTHSWQLIQGHRGNPAADLGALVTMLIRLGQLAADLPEVRELDLEPVLADAQGIVAVDIQVRVAPTEGPATARLAIAPYPDHLVSTARLRDGTPVELRPLRPEDEPLLHDLAAHMSPDDLRLRFFAPVQGLTHAVAARLSQLDYDRELALIALQGGMPLGVVHYFADPDKLRAEYAIAVRSDRKGLGLGYLLMNRLIEIARCRAIAVLVGEVLRENQPMLQMCHELGFAVTAHKADPAVIVVSKRLAGDRSAERDCAPLNGA